MTLLKTAARSFQVRFVIALILVAAFSSFSVLYFTQSQTQSRFAENENPPTPNLDIANMLAGYYAVAESWADLDTFLQFRNPTGSPDNVPLAIVDQFGLTIYTEPPFHLEPTRLLGAERYEIRYDGQIVGTLFAAPPLRVGMSSYAEARNQPQQLGPDIPLPLGIQNLLQELPQYAVAGTLAGALLGIFIGYLILRSVVRPIRDLTTATEQLAAGKTPQVVDATDHELGRLTQAFNQMSHDLRTAREARLQMTADIAHDLRTPLTVLLGYTEPLQSGRLHGTPELYEVLHNEALHLKHLVDDLRTLSLADTDGLTLNKRMVDPRALLERTAIAFFPTAEENDVMLKIDAAEQLPLVNVDSQRMTQVLNNLVSNALKYTPADGTITLSADASAETLTMVISDTGSGIAPADLPHIFERLYKVDKARTRKFGSSGLGLAIARSVVQAHGGTIRANSTVDVGTDILITLPLHS